ncbi:MAG: hypothetical protein OEW04_11320 [Nitrospirota bacterium]|nr:hypothetical protein [Nitrospirota bacterium]
MINKPAYIAKITRPGVSGILQRKRLFRLLDESRRQPVIWITAPGGYGKTTLVADYLDSHKLPCLWYQVDKGDDDPATFFYYLGLASKKAAPRYRRPLPLLTPEYLLGLPTFTLRYFEEFYRRVQVDKASSGRVKIRGKHMTAPFFIILDNYQEVPASSMFHEIIRGAMEFVPDAIKVIVISRTGPPEAFARMRANSRMGIIGFDELRLTEEETAGIMRLKVKDAFTKDCVKSVHGRTQGWAAGLVLLLEKLRRGEGEAGSCNEGETEMVFDYFASEIFQKAEADTQVFLLKTAFFPYMDVRMAERLGAANNARRILSDLVRNNYFTERRHKSNPVYQYHPLFRDFLLSKTRDFFTAEDIRRLQQETALLLEEAGNVEDAVNLYLSSSDHEGVIRLIMTHAPAFVAEGRSRVIDKWIMSIPKEMRDSAPWLLYWLGVCRMIFNGEESEECLERAFNEFRLRKDALGTYLSWAGIVDCNYMGMRDSWKLDKWIDVIGEVMREHPSFPSREVEAHVSGGMLYALSARRPNHPAINDWAERLNTILPKIRGTYLKMNLFSYLSTHYLWKGDIGRLRYQIKLMNNEVQLMAHSASPTYPLALIYLKHLEATCSYLVAEPEASLKRLKEAMGIGDTNGIHVWDFLLLGQSVSAAFCSSDFVPAEELLKRMRSFLGMVSNFCISYYHHQNAWYTFLRGNDKESLMHAELSLEYAIASGNVFACICSHIAMANVSFKAGGHQKALQLLTHALKTSRRMNSNVGEFMALITEAHFAMEKGHEEKCLEALRNAFAIGRETAIMHFLFWIPSRMSKLCAKALEKGIETEYVETLIKKRGMVPDDPHVCIESWPYPVKIYTFGRFDIFRDEKPVSSSDKVQKKPVEMLKALIALGGTNVREEQLTDFLWPQADGDAAHNVFRMTLSRLRQQCGSDNIIKMQDGRLTLNQGYCYVDAWGFERICNQVEPLLSVSALVSGKGGPGRGKTMPHLDEITRLTEKAVALYKGHFLINENDQIWTLSMRERLRNKFIRLISMSGQYCELAGKFDRASEYYRKGLDMDSLCEELYQRLMKCYGKLGRRAEAILLYNHCRETFSSVLGISPSPETEAICRRLKSNHSF